MEESLAQIIKDGPGNKHSALRQSCQQTLELLKDKNFTDTAEPSQLREKCLAPLQMALESKNTKLALHGISGIQKLLQDERFQSSMETEGEEGWLPMQVLKSVSSTPTLSEEVQVEVMKVLLNMAFSTAWCMNARVITKISELCLTTFLLAPKQAMRNIIVKMLLRILGVFSTRSSKTSQTIHTNSPSSGPEANSEAQVVLDTYNSTVHGSVRTAVKATMNQLLSAIADRLHESDSLRVEVLDDVLAEFTTSDYTVEAESLSKDVVTLLEYLCEKLEAAHSGGQMAATTPLLLDGIHAVLSKVPSSIQTRQDFVDLIWQRLCPALVSTLGNPLSDKSVTSQKASSAEEVGRGSGCSSSAPNVHTQSAKAIYGISVELVRLVGHLQSLRPVLESLFHRILLYPPPVHRLEALRAIKQLLNNTENVLALAGPTQNDTDTKSRSSSVGAASSKKKQHNSELALLKLIMDSVQECCHCNDSTVCITSVGLVVDLLTSVEQLVKGQGLSEARIKEILWQYRENDGIMGLIPPTPPNTDRDFTDSSEDSDSGLNYLVNKRRQQQMRDRSPCGSMHSDKDSQHSISRTHSPCVADPEKDDTEPEPAARKLHNSEEIEMKYRVRAEKTDFAALEKQCAQKYIEELMKCLPKLLECMTTSEVDEMIQQFSSDVCAAISSHQSAILNADGVYLATYSALTLNLKLIHTDYYNSDEKSLPMAESQFVDEILHTGLLLYLTPAWLAEVFHQVISQNLLLKAGYHGSASDAMDYPLVQILTDIDGLGSRKHGGQMLSTYQERAEQELDNKNSPQVNTPAEDAGQKLSRRIMLTCWDAILDVLSVLVNGKSACGITSSLVLMLNAKEESYKAREAICTSLDGLQKAARLTSVLGLQDRCSAVFAQLANASCVSELELLKRERQQQQAVQTTTEKKLPGPLAPLGPKPKLARLHAAHALSMDVVLSIGLEMGSHAADCWLHVFRCCAHIAELEHVYFSHGKNQSALPKVQRDAPQQMEVPNNDTLDLGGGDYYSTLVVATPEPLAPSLSMADVLKQCSMESGWDTDITGGGVLKPDQASKVLCGLSQEVDRLFEDAANKLNMKGLVNFLGELCKASRQQLSTHGPMTSIPGGLELQGSQGSGSLPTTAMHLYRLGDIVMKCIRSGRPLLHIMHVWSVVAPHLVEAACHRDHNISKKAVNCIHEFVNTLLSCHPELPYFHFNESLCKPFENLLCLELCDGDIQDQIVCSICELVEACTTDIKSGWRPLFGALRAVKIEYTANEEVNEARQRHIAAVLDVFDVFLNTDNVLVFANAAVDCILCLLKYVRGPGEFEDGGDDESDSGSDLTGPSSNENLCLPALKYLEQCCSILADMWNMPACPVFDGAQRIQEEGLRTVDPVIPNVNLKAFQKPFLDKTSADQAMADLVSHNNCDDKKDDTKSQTSLDSGIGVISVDHRKVEECAGYVAQSLEQQDKHTGVLHVWFLVLEGLASTAAACPKNYQPQTLDTLFSLMRSAAQVPGPTFALYCVNHLLLPTLQGWLRRGNQITAYWDQGTMANFKQCAGLCTDLVVEYIIQFAHMENLHLSVELMLKQLLDVLCECVSRPVEALSRLGCACIRHCLLSSGPLLTEHMWYTAAQCLQHTCDMTLYCLRQLMTPFQAHSDNFYGDIGQVKVAVRKDCSSLESERLRQLAQQVFLLDSQCGTSSVIDYEVESDRSYIFLIYPPEQTGDPAEVTRVPFRSVVVGLLSHQILVQTLGCLLLHGTSNTVRSESSLMVGTGQGDATQADSLMQDTPLPGMMRYLSCRTVLVLLQCLYDSYKAAKEFDARPGLKFLIQKVAKADVACNMYKQAGVSLTFYIHTLIEICSHQDNICLENTRNMLAVRSCNQGPSAEAKERGQGQDQSHSEGQGQPEGQNQAEEDAEVAQTTCESQPKSYSTNINTELVSARNHLGGLQQYIGLFTYKLKEILDRACVQYVDMYLDKEGPNIADRLSSQTLVFLLVPQEDIPTLKRDKSIKEMVAEKLKKGKVKENGPMVGSSAEDGPVSIQPVPQQEEVCTEDSKLLPADSAATPPRLDSPTSSPKKDKAICDTGDDKVYTVATDKTIKTLMSEYKKRKQVHSMPTFVKATRSKLPPSKNKDKKSSSDPMEQEIQEQQLSSIMKDSDAQLNSWIEMICNVLQLLHQLPDYQYQALLPCVCGSVSQLVCHSKHPRLREVLAQWTHRISHVYGFAPPGDTGPPRCNSPV